MPALSPQKLNENTVPPDILKKVSGGYWYPKGTGNYVGNQRYSYSTLPEKFMGSIFIRFFNDTISNPTNQNSKLQVFYNENIEQVLEGQHSNLLLFSILYYVFFILIGIGLYIFIAYKVLDIY